MMHEHRLSGRCPRSMTRRLTLGARASLCCVSCRGVDSKDGGTGSTAPAAREVRTKTTTPVHLDGVVTYVGPDVLFVQHSAGGSRLERTPSASDLVWGDHVA